MPWTDKQTRMFAARAHDPKRSTKERKKFRGMLMETSPRQRSRAMRRGKRG